MTQKGRYHLARSTKELNRILHFKFSTKPNSMNLPLFVVIVALISAYNCSPCGSYPCIPGEEYLGIGYDAVQGQSTGAPIFQFTFDQKNFWVNPFQTNQTSTFSFADQITVTNVYGMKTLSWSFEDAFSYSKFLANQYGIDVSTILDGSGWFTSQVAEMQQKVESEGQTYSVTEQSISLYELTNLPSRTLLSKTFQQDAMSLPVKYDYETYLSFIQSYGTHVVVSATLGGKSSYKTFADSVYTETNSNFVLGGNARSDFYEVKGSVGGDYSHSRATSDFKTHGVSNYDRAGGDPTIDKNQWRDWVDTVGYSPVVIKSQLKLISDLVQDKTRSAFLKQTIDTYSSTNAVFSNDTNGKTLLLSQCNCYEATLPEKCQNSELMQGFNDAYGISYCCTPCFTWQLSSFSDTIDQFSSSRPKPSEKESSLKSFVKSAERRNRAASSKCGEYECIPGLDAFGVMFDAVKGQSKNLPAIEFTFSMGKTWQNPLNPNLVYAVPDQVLVVNDPEESQYYELINYQNVLSTSAGLDLNFLGFGLSDEVSSSVDTFFRMADITSNEISFYKFALSFRWNISKEMAIALRGLSADLSSEKYTRFFQTYGTHYITAATYGGKSKMLTSVNQQYYSNNTEDQVQAMVGLMYDGFSLGFSENVTEQSGFSDFYSATFSEFYLEGGDYLKYSANQLKEWKKSIGYAPTQLRYKLQPIHTLITDPEMRQEFILAASEYSQSVLSSSTSILLPTNEEGSYEQNIMACPNGWAMLFMKDDGYNHFEPPFSCTTYDWSVGNLPAPEPCNCQTVDDDTNCPVNLFITQATEDTLYYSVPSPPMTCCGVCV